MTAPTQAQFQTVATQLQTAATALQTAITALNALVAADVVVVTPPPPPPPPVVTANALSVTSPLNKASVSGTISVVGVAGSDWVNVAAYDVNNANAKVGNDVTPANNAFTLSINTANLKLVGGVASIAVMGFSTPPGAGGGLTPAVVDLSLTVAGAVVVTPPPPPPPTGGSLTAPAGYTAAQLIWQDNFATYDSTKWYQGLANLTGLWNGTTSPPYSGSNSGGFNAEYYAPNQLAFGASGLVITAEPDTSLPGYTWKSGTLSTGGKWLTPPTGCFIQFLAEMPDCNNGAWPSFWFLDYNGETVEVEMDLYEGSFFDGAGDPLNNIVSTTLHQTALGTSDERQYNPGFSLAAGFHVYGIEIIPGVSIKTYLDGVLKETFTSNIPNAQFTMQITLAMGQNRTWGSVANVATAPGPFVMKVQEMQVYGR